MVLKKGKEEKEIKVNIISAGIKLVV